MGGGVAGWSGDSELTWGLPRCPPMLCAPSEVHGPVCPGVERGQGSCHAGILCPDASSGKCLEKHTAYGYIHRNCFLDKGADGL